MNRSEKVADLEEGIVVNSLKTAFPDVSFEMMLNYATVWERFLFLVGAVASTLAGLGLVVNFTLSGFLFDKAKAVFDDKDNAAATHQWFMDNMLLVGAVALGLVGITYLGMVCFAYVGEKISYRLRKQYLQAVLLMDMETFDEVGTGEITTRMSGDVDLVRIGMGEKMGMMFTDAGVIMAGAIISCMVSWWLALWVYGGITLCLLLATTGSSYVGGQMTKSLGEKAKGGSFVEESFSGIRTVHAFNKAYSLVLAYAKHNKSAENPAKRRIFVESLLMGLVVLGVYFGIAACLLIGPKLIAEDLTSHHQVFVVIICLFLSTYSIVSIPPNILAMIDAKASAKKLLQVIRHVPRVKSGESRPENLLGRLEFKDVGFSFPSRPDVPVLQNFNLEVKPGSTLALVGGSGSGKSTIVQLVERFYDATRGSVRVDGYNLRDLDLSWYRSQIGFVSQDPVLFSGTIAENVAMGLNGFSAQNMAPNAWLEAIVTACRASNAHEFISKLPHKYNTQVGANGCQLSGGQKQRIAIARAIVSNPTILILDEPTSKLDPACANAVHSALRYVTKGRTTIIVSHNMAAIRKADQICVLEGGKVVQMGDHEKLIMEEGIYAEMAKVQENQDRNIPVFSPPRPSHIGPKKAALFFPQVPSSFKLAQSAGAFFASIWNVFKISLSDFYMYAIGSFGVILMSLLNLAILYTIGQKYHDNPNSFISKNMFDVDNLGGFFVKLAIIAGVASVTQALTLTFFGFAAENLSSRIRCKLFDAIMWQETSWFSQDSHSTGKLVVATDKVAHDLSSFAGTSLMSIVSLNTALIGTILLGCYLNLQISLMMMLALPVILVLGLFALYIITVFTNRTKEGYELAYRQACESISNIRTVISLNLEAGVMHRYKLALRAPMHAGIMRSFVPTLILSFSAAIPPFMASLGFMYAAKLMGAPDFDAASNPKYLLGVISVVMIFVLVLIEAIHKIPLLSSIKLAKDAAKFLYSVQNQKTTSSLRDDAPGKKYSSIGDVRGNISFQNVVFSYPDRPENTLIVGLDAQIPANTFVALVGPSGCGKSTIIDLLERFHQPTSGNILLDGTNIKEVHLGAYRDNIALVEESPVLYDMSIKENILMGSRYYEAQPNITQIYDAAKVAGLHDFITSLPNGYETVIGTKGVSLSGGQKQRLAIARAIVRNPKILLLDEITSSLDSVSEAQVVKAIREAAIGRTVICIAHRLHTIKHADLILVMKNGGIQEKGRHEDLLAIEGGIYAKMVQDQVANNSLLN